MVVLYSGRNIINMRALKKTFAAAILGMAGFYGGKLMVPSVDLDSPCARAYLRTLHGPDAVSIRDAVAMFKIDPAVIDASPCAKDVNGAVFGGYVIPGVYGAFGFIAGLALFGRKKVAAELPPP